MNNANEIILPCDRKPTIEHYNSFIDDDIIKCFVCFACFFVVAWFVMVINL